LTYKVAQSWIQFHWCCLVYELPKVRTSSATTAKPRLVTRTRGFNRGVFKANKSFASAILRITSNTDAMLQRLFLQFTGTHQLRVQLSRESSVNRPSEDLFGGQTILRQRFIRNFFAFILPAITFNSRHLLILNIVQFQ